MTFTDEVSEIWDAKHFMKLHTLTGYEGGFSRDSEYFWTISQQERELALWDVLSGSKLHSFPIGERAYFFHKQDYALILEDTDNPEQMRFRAWDFKAEMELWNFTMDENLYIAAVISPDDKYVVVGQEYGELRLRDIQTGAIIRKFC